MRDHRHSSGDDGRLRPVIEALRCQPAVMRRKLATPRTAFRAVDFESIDPEEYGTPTGYNSLVDPLCGVAGQFPSYNSAGTLVCTAFPSGGIGPVAAGWVPGDPFNCVAAGQGLSGTPCTGTPFLDVDSTPTPGSAWAEPAALRTGSGVARVQRNGR